MTTFAQRQTVTYVAVDAELEQTHPNYVTNYCVYMQSEPKIIEQLYLCNASIHHYAFKY